MSKSENSLGCVGMTVDIVSAYISKTTVAPAELLSLIESTHSALVGVATGKPVAKAPAGPLQPAVPVKKSVTPDYIICLEDGRSFKSLKRHLRAKYNLSAEQYRAKWGLPADYPMVAPNYARARSDLAKAIGLGQPREGVLQAA
ncbi:MucR family transcriptional regulator [Methylobacterium aerolatum]|nr:MucR family transcriptional regulator [Methylobacterium aerolatum]GJD35673.1 Transcriptional regulatory protein ros [Methylobacterium aerolatum]